MTFTIAIHYNVIMGCKNKFCVYNRKLKCIKDEISVNKYGQCAYIFLPKVKTYFSDEEKQDHIDCYKNILSDLSLDWHLYTEKLKIENTEIKLTDEDNFKDIINRYFNRHQ